MRRASLAWSVVVGLGVVAASGAVSAGQITAYGNVVPLNNINQMAAFTGRATFDSKVSGSLNLTEYQDQGIRFIVDDLPEILPGCTTTGKSYQPYHYTNYMTDFVNPTTLEQPPGGGMAEVAHVYHAGVATFTVPVTQFGLTARDFGLTYITAWDQNGHLIGQVEWNAQLNPTPGFVGLDTQGIPIAMIAYGNDDIYSGEGYSASPGTFIVSDTWVWGPGECQVGQVTADPSFPNVTALTSSRQMGVAAGIAEFDELTLCPMSPCPTASGYLPVQTYTGDGMTFVSGLAAIEGTTDSNSIVYGAGGDLEGTTLSLIVDGGTQVDYTFAAAEPATATDLLSLLAAAFPNASFVQQGGGGLVVGSNTLGDTGSIDALASSVGNADLTGLTYGAGGDLESTTISLAIDGAGQVDHTFAAGEPTDLTDLLSELTTAFPGASFTQQAGTSFLVITSDLIDASA